MQGIPEPCFFNRLVNSMRSMREGRYGKGLTVHILGRYYSGIIRFLFGFYSGFPRFKTQGSECLAYALKGINIRNEACSNSLLFMPLRSYARHP